MSDTRNWRSLDRFAFGDSPALADMLLGLVLAGRKTATCWAVRDGSMTEVGKHMVVLDGAGRARAVVETVALDQCMFDHVDAEFAAAEGESDLSLTTWRAGHQRFFERNGGFAGDMLLWCERFRLVATLVPDDRDA